MKYPDATAPRKTLRNCHDGTGELHCVERFADYKRKTPGIKFVHEDLLPPGASIGEHAHRGDEEIYLILEGNGQMTLDGETVEVGPGDLCLTRSGHSHSLRNTGNTPLRLVVVCANTPEVPS